MQQSIPEDDEHLRPNTVSDATVAAVGKVSEALETIEQARGHLYALHQLIGHADLMFDDAVSLLQEAGHEDQAQLLKSDVIDRNVLPGRWTFQIVEEFNDTYYDVVQKFEQQLRNDLVQGKRHIYESEMKEQRRTNGKAGHEPRP